MRSLAAHNSYGETSIKKMKKSWSKGSNRNTYKLFSVLFFCGALRPFLIAFGTHIKGLFVTTWDIVYEQWVF